RGRNSTWDSELGSLDAHVAQVECLARADLLVTDSWLALVVGTALAQAELEDESRQDAFEAETAVLVGLYGLALGIKVAEQLALYVERHRKRDFDAGDWLAIEVEQPARDGPERLQTHRDRLFLVATADDVAAQLPLAVVEDDVALTLAIERVDRALGLLEGKRHRPQFGHARDDRAGQRFALGIFDADRQRLPAIDGQGDVCLFGPLGEVED